MSCKYYIPGTYNSFTQRIQIAPCGLFPRTHVPGAYYLQSVTVTMPADTGPHRGPENGKSSNLNKCQRPPRSNSINICSSTSSKILCFKRISILLLYMSSYIFIQGSKSPTQIWKHCAYLQLPIGGAQILPAYCFIVAYIIFTVCVSSPLWLQDVI